MLLSGRAGIGYKICQARPPQLHEILMTYTTSPSDIAVPPQKQAVEIMAAAMEAQATKAACIITMALWGDDLHIHRWYMWHTSISRSVANSWSVHRPWPENVGCRHADTL